MKKTALLFCLALCCTSGSAQFVWNKRLPVANVFPNLSKLASDGNSYWVCSDRSLFQFNSNGEITGRVTDAIGFSPFWVWGTKITNPNTGIPYLLLAHVGISDGKYTFAHYQPGAGILNQYVLQDSLGPISQNKGAVFVPLDDNTLLFLGQKSIRKIQHLNNGTFSEAWAKNLTFKTIAAVWTGSYAVFCDPFGNFKAIDANGNLLWEKTQLFSTKSIKLLPDGIIGCGNAGTGEGLVFKLDFNGNLLWSKMLAEAKLNDLNPVTDSGILLTGETDTLSLLVLKTDGSGNTLWTRTYEKGKGWAMEPSADGGAVVLWQATNTYKLRLAKIDAAGNTVPNETALPPVTERTLLTSGAKTVQYPSEGLFYDGSGSRLMVPADSLTSPVLINSPWIGGVDPAGNLHLAAGAYSNPNFVQDFRFGIASGSSKDFQRLWAVSREEIAQIRRDFGEDGDLDTPPPFDLLSWPSKGNPHFRQNLDFTLVTTNPDSLPAPFVDTNGDGIYNVFDGDYPRLSGDRMLWWSMNDQTVHNGSNGLALGVDVYFTLYGYDCPLNGSISQSVFANYQVINRSTEDYSNTYMGFFTDFDLGCSEDDYIGSMPEANSAYVYNQDAVDGNPGSICTNGVATYSEKVPVESATFLNQSLDHAMYYNRYEAGQPPQTVEPSTPIEYYNYLRSIWRDGTPFTMGGDGYNPGNPTALPTNYAFPDNPNDPQGWTMCTANLPFANRRSLNSHGPFLFAAGDTFNIRLAFIFHPDIPHPCPDVAGLVKPTILQIQQWHNDGTLEDHLDLGSVQTLVPGQSLLLNATQSNPATSYAWSTGQNTPSIIVNQAGEYTVTVIPASGCAYSETVLVKSASGTSSPILPTWQVQPNPAHDVLKIVFEKVETPLKALLRNAQGQLVATKSNSEARLEISVASLPDGFYWVELWHGEKFLGCRKVVVTK